MAKKKFDASELRNRLIESKEDLIIRFSQEARHIRENHSDHCNYFELKALIETINLVNEILNNSVNESVSEGSENQ